MHKTLRTVFQAAALVTVLVFAYLHTLDSVYPSSHGLCPFGGLVSLYSLLSSGTFIHRIHASSLFVLLAVLLTALLAGRAFCGWICPLGTLGEWVHKLNRKKKFRMPVRLDRILKYGKYIVLAVILYFTWTLGTLFYKGFCPWAAFMNMFDPAELIEDVLMGGIILLAVLAASYFIDRFFCRYLCPLGAALVIFNRFSLIKPIRAKECRGCGVCDTTCPVDIKISAANTINHPDCIRCYQCLDKCPDTNSLSLTYLKPALAGLLVVFVFVGTLAFTAQAGYWERGRTFGGASGQGSGIERHSEDLQSIRASTSLTEAAHIAGIPLQQLYRLWSQPDSLDPDSTVRDVTDMTGLSRRHLLDLLASARASSD